MQNLFRDDVLHFHVLHFKRRQQSQHLFPMSTSSRTLPYNWFTVLYSSKRLNSKPHVQA